MTRCTTWHASGALAVLLLVATNAPAAEPLRVLILTGANNHDWKATTPVLREIIEQCPRFQVVDVLEDPSRVTAELLAGCDVTVSNWSAYPEMTGHQWGAKAEQDFVTWVQAGHGFVVFHAAAATSQDWPEFQQLVQLTWGLNTTAHGAYHTFKVTVRAVSRDPVTVKLADAALGEAARPVNLALHAVVSSPDGLEPDGGSGPDAAAVDGDLATYWDEQDDQPLYRFQVSFAGPTTVNTVLITGQATRAETREPAPYARISVTTRAGTTPVRRWSSPWNLNENCW